MELVQKGVRYPVVYQTEYAPISAGFKTGIVAGQVLEVDYGYWVGIQVGYGCWGVIVLVEVVDWDVVWAEEWWVGVVGAGWIFTGTHFHLQKKSTIWLIISLSTFVFWNL